MYRQRFFKQRRHFQGTVWGYKVYYLIPQNRFYLFDAFQTKIKPENAIFSNEGNDKGWTNIVQRARTLHLRNRNA